MGGWISVPVVPPPPPSLPHLELDEQYQNKIRQEGFPRRIKAYTHETGFGRECWCFGGGGGQGEAGVCKSIDLFQSQSIPLSRSDAIQICARKQHGDVHILPMILHPAFPSVSVVISGFPPFQGAHLMKLPGEEIYPEQQHHCQASFLFFSSRSQVVKVK